MTRHILDRPIWDALSTRHLPFSLGNDLARKLLPEIGPFAASRDDSGSSLAALADLIPASGWVVLLQADPIVIPNGIVETFRASGVQMLATSRPPVLDEFKASIERLRDEDTPEMLELARLTRPGPFELGTSKLGGFSGIKVDGIIVAMAGERMKNTGHTEISGVCVHPDYRGRGFARALAASVANRIYDRGETPYLHANAQNTSAIHLYETLGFKLRTPMHVARLARADSP